MTKKIKNEHIHRDDSLFGLLLSYKHNNTYVRVFLNEDDASVAVILTGNPKFWSNLPPEILVNYHGMKRLEIGVEKMFIKYILPEHLIKTAGVSAGINLSADKIEVENRLEDKGYYIIHTSTRYLNRVLSGVKKLLNLSAQKKYEILEKCISEEQEK
ncbi:MAG TPA: hypothetical protein PKG60_03690 [Spirochaetota bacterium]|nr:hypothetical protein [Spirochaetota bacterium]HPS85475.1 hypothetical protein [Spirochaetota bacterium]